MKNKILLLIIIATVTFYSCEESNHIEIEKWENGNPKITFDFSNLKDSSYTRFEYYENGKIKSKQDFVKAKLHGKFIKYSDKGFKQYEGDYLNGKKNGIVTAWYESGKISLQFKYENGLFYDGTEYYEDGWPRVLVKFSAPGKREGVAYYYEEDGRIWEKGYFKNGKQDSVWTKYNKDGLAIETVTFSNGKRISNAK